MQFADKLAQVDYDPEQVLEIGLITALEGGGYQAWSTATESHQPSE